MYFFGFGQAAPARKVLHTLPCVGVTARVAKELQFTTLLTFVQRYKEDLTIEEKQALKELMRKHQHPGVTPEIRRELFSSCSRGEAKPDGMDVE